MGQEINFRQYDECEIDTTPLAEGVVPVESEFDKLERILIYTEGIWAGEFHDPVIGRKIDGTTG